MSEQAKSVLAAGVLLFGTVAVCLVAAYAFVWLCSLVGALVHLAVEDLDAMTLAGLMCIALVVCGFVTRQRRH